LLLKLQVCVVRVDFNVPMKNGVITSNQRYVILTDNLINNKLTEYSTKYNRQHMGI